MDLNFMMTRTAQAGSSSGSGSDLGSSSLLKNSGVENDVVAPRNLSFPVKIGGGKGEDHGVVAPAVDRNGAKIGVPARLSYGVKIGGGEDEDVVAKVTEAKKVKIQIASDRNEAKTGVISPAADRNEAKSGVPLSEPVKVGGGEDNDGVAPVADGNKVKIQVSVPMRVGGGSGDNENNNKVKIEVPIPMKLLFPSAAMAPRYDHAQLLVQNYENFKKTGKPMRFMYYKNGSWVNFEENVMDVMVSGFVSGRQVMEVEMEGLKSLVDFYRMLEIDFATGNERSIAWIDVNGNCFFPKLFIDSSEYDSENSDKNQEIDGTNVNENNPKIEIEIKISNDDVEKEVNNPGEELKLGKRKRENDLEKAVGSSSNVNEQRVMAENEFHSSRWPKARSLREEEKGYQMVKDFLLSRLRVVDPSVAVTSVHQCIRTGPLEQARLEVFQKTVEIVTGARGNPKVVYAWCGTSAKNVEVILRHGFGMPSVVHGPNAHGVGIYLSPSRLPQNSAMMSPIDEYGEKHIILCRVILGNVEKVELGSQQLYPSSVDFDTGVDDLNNPKWYVVWCSNMNTHILPECVVSYRSARHMPGQMNGASSMRWAPHATYALSTLISRLNSLLPPPKVQELQSLYGSFREGRVAKPIFMRQLRSVVGDEMLRATILEICG